MLEAIGDDSWMDAGAQGGRRIEDAVEGVNRAR
jgi:hypothetical protein